MTDWIIATLSSLTGSYHLYPSVRLFTNCLDDQTCASNSSFKRFVKSIMVCSVSSDHRCSHYITLASTRCLDTTK